MEEKGFSHRTVNAQMSVLNTFLRYLGHRDWQVDEFVREVNDIQPELTRAEYLRLLSAAKRMGKEKTYLLIKTMGGAGVRVQELSQVTVEAVIQGMTKTEIKRYLRLLISESALKKPGCRSRLQCGMEFSSEAKRLQERMENVMKNKMCNTTVAGFVMAVLVLANSMTVFAYGDVTREKMDGEAPKQKIDQMFDAEISQFIPEHVEAVQASGNDVLGIIPEGIDFRYDEQFIDANGNVYPILDTQDDMSPTPYWGCNHDYVPGTKVLHKSLDNGGCRVTLFSAQRCSKCDLILVGEQTSETVFTKCPH